ncbi:MULTISPECIES: DNA polymerase III subunit beta [Paenibacillus]|uniref:DNA polymerase III subunit beta n=1 Tax=Paenibacillus TaxID=44249 RepID=UPI00041B6A72|nr:MULTISPECIES: DNA polymerase III subunit beta [Paenibacillus]KGP77683.1 hypothetical protein P364_0131910 [Paenibacillus sp. MAEPY2]KGP78698.1 hypothetical protein P363_0132010 [Paenibacillus sp. MAEPY1]OZQ61315.1 DNA polymerase III subunit beta [Paenibacillus taichungensis]
MVKLLDLQEQEISENVVVNDLQFEIEHEQILDVLTVCAKIVPKSGSIPILQNLKFDIKGETLFITAMDTEQSLLQMIPITNTGGSTGSFLFPAREGIDLLKRLPHGNLTFVKEGWTIHISYGKRGKANLKILSSEEYPNLPQPVTDEFLQIPSQVLRKAANAARFALGDDKTPALTGVHLYNHEGKLGFVATDRHRVFRYVTDVDILDPDQFVSALIPAIAFKHIVDSFHGEQVDLSITKHYLILREKNSIYFGRQLDLTFPLDSLNVIFRGENNGMQLSINQSELNDTLNRALSLDATNNRVTLEVDEYGVFVVHTESENSEVCDPFEDVAVGEDFPVMKFNGRYLKDAITICDKGIQNIHLRVSGSSLPGFVSFEGDPSIMVVINPVR